MTFQNLMTNSMVQANKDVHRTYNDHPYFQEGAEGKLLLTELLEALVVKYTGIGYVQGLNFICASLLYHCSPSVALDIVSFLVEDCELCDVLSPDLTGLHAQNAVIKNLLAIKLPDLYSHMVT